ncbi:MAG: prolyl oligopeptidase family serine peptidase [Planctomycetota bacterium]
MNPIFCRLVVRRESQPARRPITALFPCLLVAALALPKSLPNASAQVYRDRIEPQWLRDSTHFWYQIQTSAMRREFVFVDAKKKQRSPAFDHTAVAEKLAVELKHPVSASQLPIQRLEFSDDRSEITLIGPEGHFLWRASDSTLTRMADGDVVSSELFLPPRPSTDGSAESELVVINRLEDDIELVWINAAAEENSYGSVRPGQTRRQHTFSGHVWLLKKADGQAIGCVQASRESTQVLISPETIDSVRRTETPQLRRRRDRSASDAVMNNPRSPDGQHAVTVRNHNLILIRTDDDSEMALTSDAAAEHSFRKDASRARSVGMNHGLPDFPDHIAEAIWSPDSQFLLAMQTTHIQERLVQYIESSPRDQFQPKLQSYAYQKPGDPLPMATPRLFRISDGSEVPIDRTLFPDAWSLEFLRWSDDASHFYLLYNERGHQRLRVLEVTNQTGAIRAIVDESSQTFIHYSSEGKFELRRLPDNQLLWASERSGWNHLYRYDLKSGELLNAVTNGSWNVRRIEQIDDANRVIWFYAMGVVPGQDPYHLHFCRVNFDGSDFRVLTSGDGTHSITWSPDRRCFIDRYSRVDLPPIHELRTAAGELLCNLESADATELIAIRPLPERFTAKGRDGTTDIYGIVHRPKHFDPSKSWPVIENIYAGPHDHHVPKAFREDYRHQQQLADAGFIVVQIDGMGTAWRSKEFHDVCFRNLRDAGLPDRILWIKALKEKLPCLDLDRVGIYGGSAGGQNALAAMLWHGDFYKAAVADCGCHDNRMDKIWWNEQWMGVPEGEHYQQNSNTEHAHQLQGHLMLVVGELDRNVDPATSFQVARRLVEAEKEFDFVVVPGAGHGACETPWASKKRLAFFVKTLGNSSSASP